MNFSSIKDKIKPHYVYTALFLIAGLLLIQILGNVYGNNITGYAVDDTVGADLKQQAKDSFQDGFKAGSAAGASSTSTGSFMDPLIEAATAVITGVLNISGTTVTTITTAGWGLLVFVFIFVAAMIYLGLDMLKFIKNKTVKVLISISVGGIAIAYGGNALLTQIAKMSTALIFTFIFMIIIFLILIAWHNYRTEERTARTGTLGALSGQRVARIDYIKNDMEKNVTKMMLKALSDVKSGEKDRVIQDVAIIESNFRRIHGELQAVLMTLEHHLVSDPQRFAPGTKELVSYNEFKEEVNMEQNESKSIYVKLNNILNQAKQNLHNDLNAANDDLREAYAYLQRYESLLARARKWAEHNEEIEPKAMPEQSSINPVVRPGVVRRGWRRIFGRGQSPQQVPRQRSQRNKPPRGTIS